VAEAWAPSALSTTMLNAASSSSFASAIAARATMSGGIPDASRSTAVFAVTFRIASSP